MIGEKWQTQHLKLIFKSGAPVSLARNSAAAESEGGQKFLPPNPLPFCPPDLSAEVLTQAERSVSVLPREARQGVNFFQKRFAQSV